MAQDLNKMIDRLNNLIALDYDAARAYEAAIQRVEARHLIERLRSFQVDHERHIQELGGVVKGLGGKPRAGPDLKGFLIQGFTAVTSERDPSSFAGAIGQAPPNPIHSNVLGTSV